MNRSECLGAPPSRAAMSWPQAVVLPARPRTALVLRTMLFWVSWFAFARLAFYAYAGLSMPLPPFLLILESCWRGLRMDVSAAAYLTAVPWLLTTLLAFAPTKWLARALVPWTLFATIFSALVTVTDLQIFTAWRTRVDVGLLPYLASPREALASSESIPYMWLLPLLALVGIGTWRLARRVMIDPVASLPAGKWHTPLGLLVLAPIVVFGIRGGWQDTPLNESSVYFSANDLANQGTLTAGWNFVHSIYDFQKGPQTSPYRMMSPTEARALRDSLLPGPTSGGTALLRVAHPNVLVIVWESLTSKVVARLDGPPGVTPEFDRLTHEGVFFDSLYASGERSAMGLVALLSSFPAVPHQWIMSYRRKAESLPNLSRDLRDAGYHTSYYYGGELAFANMKAYVLAGGFERVIGEEEFPLAERTSKWGAHDHVVLSRVLGDLGRESRPFFSTVFTLSSHEPFDVPGPRAIPGDGVDALFMNAHHYADGAIGNFIAEAKQQPWWDSTLVVIVADHGTVLPAAGDGANEPVPLRYHIPMLWLGGALRVRDTVVHRFGSQVDVAPTLLAQLKRPAAAYRWGKNLLDPAAPNFTYFAHHDGFAFGDADGWLVFDERAQRALEQTGRASEAHRRRGAALLQVSFDEYLAR
jgi:hypothetical protein